MIWQNPWAWLGVATVALPVLIHLLGRGHARVQPFPSLRFLERSKLLPTKRTRIHDVFLLWVRIGILAAAVAALAQPLFMTSGRTRGLDQTLARVVILDSSASMRRSAFLDSARREAQRLAGQAQIATLIETAEPARELRGAVEWLERQTGKRELVVVSDFQIGTLTTADLAVIPTAIGVRVSQIGVPATPLELRTTSSVATLAQGLSKTTASWTGVTLPRDEGLALLASPADRARVDAAARAATSVGARLPFDSTRAVTIVYPSSNQRASTPIDAPWMTSVVASLRSDSLLVNAANSATPTIALDSTALVIARNAAGRAIVVAARADNRLALFSAVDPGTIASAALIAAADRARSNAAPLAELELSSTDRRTIASWQRLPGTNERPTGNTAGESDGRWFWIAALVLLGIETWLRRAKREAAVAELTHERAA